MTKPNPHCPTNCIADLIRDGGCDCYNNGSHPERPCFRHGGALYEIDFFFGRSGIPKDEMDETTPCVQEKGGSSFLCAECEFL